MDCFCERCPHFGEAIQEIQTLLLKLVYIDIKKQKVLILNKVGKRWNKTATYIANGKFESLMTITIFDESFTKLVARKAATVRGDEQNQGQLY